MEVNFARPRPDSVATTQASGTASSSSVASALPVSTADKVTLSQDALSLLDAERSSTIQSDLGAGTTVTPLSTGITPPPPPPEEPEKEN